MSKAVYNIIHRFTVKWSLVIGKGKIFYIFNVKSHHFFHYYKKVVCVKFGVNEYPFLMLPKG